MPSYFFRCTRKGILVTNRPLVNRAAWWSGPKPILVNYFDEIVVNGFYFNDKSADEVMEWIRIGEIRFGFFCVDNPEELELKSGDEVPVYITGDLCNSEKSSIWPTGINVCWASPD